MTKQPPTSLRIPEQTRQRVEAYAAERGIPRNAAYVELLDQALARLRQPNSLAAVKSKGSVPPPSAKRNLAENNIPTSRKVFQAGVGVSVGPQRAAPGSRLKGAKK